MKIFLMLIAFLLGSVRQILAQRTLQSNGDSVRIESSFLTTNFEGNPIFTHKLINGSSEVIRIDSQFVVSAFPYGLPYIRAEIVYLGNDICSKIIGCILEEGADWEIEKKRAERRLRLLPSQSFSSTAAILCYSFSCKGKYKARFAYSTGVKNYFNFCDWVYFELK